MGTRYFAYGSNMDLTQMGMRCPSSQFWGPAMLPNWSFQIGPSGYATVVREPCATVHGVVWELSVVDEARLDAYEGVQEQLYSKQNLLIELPDSERVTAMVYVMNAMGRGIPLPGYMEGIIASAKGHSFPKAYLAELARWRDRGRR